MTRFLLSFILTGALTLSFAFPLSAQKAVDWTFKGEKEGVKVYYKKADGIYEIKLTTSIKASLSGIIHLFYEVDRYDEWGYKISESRLLEKIDETEMLYYSRLDFPWPLSDRDVVMRSRLIQNPETGVLTSYSVAEPHHLAEYDNVVRITNARTKWVMYPNDTGWLYLEYFIYSDPGGMIPDWAVNMALDVGPLETIRRIRNLMKEPKYQQVKLAHIKE